MSQIGDDGLERGKCVLNTDFIRHKASSLTAIMRPQDKSMLRMNLLRNQVNVIPVSTLCSGTNNFPPTVEEPRLYM